MTASAGFFLASNGVVDARLLVTILVGFSLAIASACVINNVIDINVDAKMTRTKNRELPTGQISRTTAIVFGALLLIASALVLNGTLNRLSIILGLIAYVLYVFVYAFFKRKSIFGTAVGAIPGAAPPVIAYIAVTGNVDGAALILLFILFSWQLAHFYAISIYRVKDYKSAKIPVMSIKKGISYTKKQIILSILLFILSCTALTVFGYMNLLYLIPVLIFNVYWLRRGVISYRQTNDFLWARTMFLMSLIGLSIFSISVSVNSFLV